MTLKQTKRNIFDAMKEFLLEHKPKKKLIAIRYPEGVSLSTASLSGDEYSQKKMLGKETEFLYTGIGRRNRQLIAILSESTSGYEEKDISIKEHIEILPKELLEGRIPKTK